MDKSVKGSFAASVTSGKNKTLAENNVRKMRSLTDKEYEELFDGILRQSLISEAMESDQAMSLSQKEYATLQPAIIYDELNTNLDCEVDFSASPKTNKKGVDFRQPNKKIHTASQNNAVKQPIWKSTKTISDVKSINKSNRKAEMNSVGKKACYSMDTSASKKAKGKNQKSKGITSRNGELVMERGKDCKGDCAEEEWSLTQECNKGVWIQCGEPDCGKWRHLVNMHDPSQFINIKWKCSDSEDTFHNTCESPMESWDQHANWTYNRFTEGSIVWAKLDGYPWWPGMIEVDPDMQAFVFCFEHSYYTPAEYHVTFFDTDKVTRAWVCKKSVKPFIASRIWEQMNGKSNNKRLQDAVNQAEESLNLSLVQRLRNYGFASRYEGRIVGHTSPSKSSLQTQCTSTAQKGAIEKPVKKTKSRKSTNLSEQTQETVAKKSTNHAARKKQQNKNTEDKGGKQKACTKNTNSVGSSNKESTRKSAKGKKISTLPVSGKLDELTCSALMPNTENPPAVNVSKATSLPADSQTTSRDSQQFVDMEKELDEIESILSQSLMSQHSLSLSPAPQRSKTLVLTTNNNRPLTPTHNRDRSFSPTLNQSKSVSPVRNADSMCSPAPTAYQSGQEAHSQAGSQPKNADALPKPLSGSSQSKLKISNSQSSGTVSPAFGRNAVKKPTKKGFKCPTRTVNLNKDQEASSKSVSIGGLNLADTSIFTQELSGAPATQMSSALQPLKLSNNSLFTQELSGKDPFTRASNIEPDHKILHSQGADSATAFDKENLPLSPSNRPIQSGDPLYPLNNSIFTQELSCKNVFIPASNVECGHDQLAGFDSSVFTQELSNKVRPQKRQIKGSRKAKKISKMAEEDYGSYSEGSSDSDADVINTQEPSDLNILDIPRES